MIPTPQPAPYVPPQPMRRKNDPAPIGDPMREHATLVLHGYLKLYPISCLDDLE